LRQLLDEMKQYVGVFDDPQLARLTNDSAVIIPHTLIPDSPPQWIELRANPRDVLPLRDRLQQELSATGYEPIVYSNAILPVLYGETIKSLVQLNRTVFVLSICVGTAIVCAIMVLSVVERQREIAIRRVEGARQWHIALQFIVETGTLCLVGGIAGVPLGLAIAAIRCALEPMGSVTWVFPPLEVSIIISVVTAIGLIGGLLPAWRAMRVDPVEMLKYE
jgi:cell division protein FtsX